jgi:two-component system NtrC family response regulator
VVEYATILCDHPPIALQHLPRHFSDKHIKREVRASVSNNAPIKLKDMEVRAVQEAIDRHKGNKPAAAEELGISLKTLYNKLNQAEPKKSSA